MLWNIRKKKFIAIIIIVFAIAIAIFLAPEIASIYYGVPITANSSYAISFGGNGFIFLLIAIGIAVNSISSEFEGGTIVPLVTKPVSRTMILLGKIFTAFILLVVSYTVLYGFITVASTAVYGSQINLQYMPLIVVGSIVSTMIWISLLFALGSITKNTMVTVIAVIGLFLALLIAVPIASDFGGPSPVYNYLPGTGNTGYLITNSSNLIYAGGKVIGSNGTSVSSGTDDIGTNLVNYALYPNANVTYLKLNLAAVRANETAIPATGIAFTQSTSAVAFTSLSIGLAYTVVFLIVAWVAFKRSQILE
jgi:ABC-type transport system involved in multi-copper enzyme maturation permease subunit